MISIWLTDITSVAADAIVNSANTSLLAGSGLSGLIHQAAGPDLEQACRTLGPCPTGEARITPGFALPARHVIHAVGPRWWDGSRQEHQLLERTYQAIFALVRDHGLTSIAIPAIGTKIHRFPLDQATTIAVTQARLAEAALPHPIGIIFCCLDHPTAAAYRACHVPDHEPNA
jgi:O-acetyl-ADP-ribose deacetylase (regulator of RNase III)